eukprot:g6481.t1
MKGSSLQETFGSSQMESPQQTQGLIEKLGNLPLRLIIVGHNPSGHAWSTGHYYSNPGNWMWRILISTGIAPPEVQSAADDDLMLTRAGVGFTDLGTGTPGTDSSQFNTSVLQSWSLTFLDRLREHLRKANASIGCHCGNCGAPRFVAFAGKRQWIELFNSGRRSKDKIKSAPIGRQSIVPLNWPFPESTEIWLLPSTSGASALTRDQRQGPYNTLAEELSKFPFPDHRQIHCIDK